LLEEVLSKQATLALVDHGAGKSYLGFILYDLFFKAREVGHIYGIETRAELVEKSQTLASKLLFPRMSFLNVSVEESIGTPQLPAQIDVVTALHACNTATDDAIKFALQKQAKIHRAGAMLSSRSRRHAEQTQKSILRQNRTVRDLASSYSHPRVR